MITYERHILTHIAVTDRNDQQHERDGAPLTLKFRLGWPSSVDPRLAPFPRVQLLSTTLLPSRNCSNEPNGVFAPLRVMTSLEYCAV